MKISVLVCRNSIGVFPETRSLISLGGIVNVEIIESLLLKFVRVLVTFAVTPA